MESYGCLVGAYFFHGVFDDDRLAVDVEALLCEFLGYLDVGNGAEDGAGGAYLGGDGECHAVDLGCEFLGVLLDLGQLVGALFELFGQDFLGRGGSDDGFSLGDEVVAAVSVLDGDDVVLITEVGYVFFQYIL